MHGAWRAALIAVLVIYGIGAVCLMLAPFVLEVLR